MRSWSRFLLLLGLVAGVTTVSPAVLGQDPPSGEAPPAESTPASVPSALDSPASTVRSFVTAMYAGDRDRGAECLDLSLVEKSGAQDRALDLYRCFNRLELIDFDNPRTFTAPTADRVGDRTSWAFFPATGRLRPPRRMRDVAAAIPEGRIVLRRMPTGEWRFDAQTVQDAGGFLEQLKAGDFTPVTDDEVLFLWERIEGLWPDSLVAKKFLNVKYWQWIAMFIVVLAGIVLDFTTRLIVTRISRRAIRKRGAEARNETLRRTVRPFGLTAAALLWLWALQVLGLPDDARKVLVPAVRLFAMLAMVWSAFRVTDLVGEVAASKATTTDTKFDDVLIPLVRKALKVFIFVFGLIYIADSLDVPLAPLLTGIGIGGAGFAFAAKDSLEHLFGSVTVIADRPFQVGDWVKIGDVEGTVEELGFRSTRVRTFYNSLVTVPNGTLVRAVVDNYGRRKYRRWTTHLNVTYDTSPELLEAFCEGVREIIRLHPYTRKDYYQVWLHKFGAHSLDILLYMFFEAPDWNTELRERHRLMMDILRLAERLGVEFAFPTQTLHVQPQDAAPARAPGEAPDAEADRRARAIGKRAVRAITANARWREEKPPPYVFEFAAEIDEDDETQIETTTAGGE